MKENFILVLAIYIVLATLFLTYYPSFSVFNSRWNGYSSFMSVGSEIFNNFTILSLFNESYFPDDPTGCVLVVISPCTPLTEEECSFIFNFVREGGGLLLAEDFRKGKSLSEVFGVKLSGKLLMDPSYYSKQPYFPLINLQGRGYENLTILLNYPSSLSITEELRSGSVNYKGENVSCNFRIVGCTTKSACLDVYENMASDPGDVYGSFPVALIMEFGSGRIAVLSDPDVFINDMIDRYDNREFLKLLLEYLSNGSYKALYYYEYKLWRLKPPFIYVLNLRSLWSDLTVFQKLFLSAILSLSLILSSIVVLSFAFGWPLIESIISMLPKAKGEVVTSIDEKVNLTYDRYLLPLLDNFCKKLYDTAGLDYSSDINVLVSSLKAKYPRLDTSMIRMVLDYWSQLSGGAGAEINDFRTFSMIFDNIIEISSIIGIEW